MSRLRTVKMGHLNDRNDFASDPGFEHFPRNSLTINQMAWKNAQIEGRQNRVTYNYMPCVKPEKRTFLGSGRTPVTGVRKPPLTGTSKPSAPPRR
jgi:hypothetical protein